MKLNVLICMPLLLMNVKSRLLHDRSTAYSRRSRRRGLQNASTATTVSQVTAFSVVALQNFFVGLSGNETAVELNDYAFTETMTTYLEQDMSAAFSNFHHLMVILLSESSTIAPDYSSTASMLPTIAVSADPHTSFPTPAPSRRTTSAPAAAPVHVTNTTQRSLDTALIQLVYTGTAYFSAGSAPPDQEKVQKTQEKSMKNRVALQKAIDANTANIGISLKLEDSGVTPLPQPPTTPNGKTPATGPKPSSAAPGLLQMVVSTSVAVVVAMSVL